MISLKKGPLFSKGLRHAWSRNPSSRFPSPCEREAKAFTSGQGNNSSERRGEQCRVQRLGRVGGVGGVAWQTNTVRLNSLGLTMVWWWQQA